MREKVAIVAHFDLNNRLEPNFKQVINCLEALFDKVVLVTTSDVGDETVKEFSKTTLIRRPNIGYDFYSYKVGIAFARRNFDVECLLITNSSYFLTSVPKYMALLEMMIADAHSNSIVGLTESRQFEWHLQSYMMILGAGILRSQWFSAYVSDIKPLNSKFEIIFNYEIGFSSLVKKNDVAVTVLYQPDIFTSLSARYKWFKRLLTKSSVWNVLSLNILKNVGAINWTHFAVRQISDRFGLIKSEVLRTNPHGLDLSSVKERIPESFAREIRLSLAASKGSYKLNANGLSEFSAGTSPLPSYRSVQWGVAHVKGVRLAVVIHLYYYDLLGEILRYLKCIVEPFDLYITTPFEGDVSFIIDDASRVATSVTVHVSENRGRDIGPFLSLYLSGVLDGYLAVLKLHSKKSKYSAAGEEWRKSIYGSLMGSSRDVIKIVDLFENRNVGIIGPHQYYLSNERFWGANKGTVTGVLSTLGVISDDGVPPLGFFAGSMFWFSPKALSPLKRLSPSYLVFPQENGMQDGTTAHAFERIFCPLSRYAGLKTSSLKLGGEEIDSTPTDQNSVPVL